MFIQLLFFVLSLIITMLFFLYGFNHYYLLNAARGYRPPLLPDDPSFRPEVSIHLPVYNERYVIRRLVIACADMAEEYGVEKVNILILDDSDDDTVQEVDEVVAEYSQQHFKIEVLRRANREGFKAGALQAALERTSEEFIAIFDADFIPPANFLLLTLPYFALDEHLGIIQSRWTHLNRDYNFLTRAIALGIDVHFFVEQTGRYAAGCFQNFNGSGGVLRKKGILEAGGWSADTLAEDLDLSYRMQGQGYKVLYLKDILSPGELPPTLPSFKKQQGRWANGSLRTARKILPDFFFNQKFGGKQRLQAFIHLTGFMIQPLMLCSFVLTCLATLFGSVYKSTAHPDIFTPAAGIKVLAGIAPSPTFQNLIWAILLPFIVLCTLAPWISTLTTLKVQGLSPFRQLPTLFVLLLLGFGLSLSNTREAIKALFTNRICEFNRTPKYADLKNGQDWRTKRYQISMDPLWVAEFFFVVLGLLACGSAIRVSNFSALLILVPFTSGYGFVLLFSVLQSRKGKA
jgi:cellulose synthase/poly-beta-1,6-N-acetylglucosamine synthase-like glycosyltransferase